MPTIADNDADAPRMPFFPLARPGQPPADIADLFPRRYAPAAALPAEVLAADAEITSLLAPEQAETPSALSSDAQELLGDRAEAQSFWRSLAAAEASTETPADSLFMLSASDAPESASDAPEPAYTPVCPPALVSDALHRLLDAKDFPAALALADQAVDAWTAVPAAAAAEHAFDVADTLFTAWETRTGFKPQQELQILARVGLRAAMLANNRGMLVESALAALHETRATFAARGITMPDPEAGNAISGVTLPVLHNAASAQLFGHLALLLRGTIQAAYAATRLLGSARVLKQDVVAAVTAQPRCSGSLGAVVGLVEHSKPGVSLPDPALPASAPAPKVSCLRVADLLATAYLREAYLHRRLHSLRMQGLPSDGAPLDPLSSSLLAIRTSGLLLAAGRTLVAKAPALRGSDAAEELLFFADATVRLVQTQLTETQQLTDLYADITAACRKSPDLLSTPPLRPWSRLPAHADRQEASYLRSLLDVNPAGLTHDLAAMSNLGAALQNLHLDRIKRLPVSLAADAYASPAQVRGALALCGWAEVQAAWQALATLVDAHAAISAESARLNVPLASVFPAAVSSKRAAPSWPPTLPSARVLALMQLLAPGHVLADLSAAAPVMLSHALLRVHSSLDDERRPTTAETPPPPVVVIDAPKPAPASTGNAYPLPSLSVLHAAMGDPDAEQLLQTVHSLLVTAMQLYQLSGGAPAPPDLETLCTLPRLPQLAPLLLPLAATAELQREWDTAEAAYRAALWHINAAPPPPQPKAVPAGHPDSVLLDLTKVGRAPAIEPAQAAAVLDAYANMLIRAGRLNDAAELLTHTSLKHDIP
jgi:hypothetical protein